MGTTHLTLRNFRCFENLELTFTEPFIVIEGPNGCGKSSIVEALYYACYLKSFRTHRPYDVARQQEGSGPDTFFLKLQLESSDGDSCVIQVGLEDKVKRVKVNEVIATTYKELMDVYKALAISEHDLGIVQEGPECRRALINQLCVLLDPVVAEALRMHTHFVEQRNHLLLTGQVPADYLKLWTEKVWTSSHQLVESRQKALCALQEEVTQLQRELALPVLHDIQFTYKEKGALQETFETFWEEYSGKYSHQERQYKRTLFGAHLDDILITFDGKNARLYASRGQQKLIVLLIKLAMMRIVKRLSGNQVLILLVDDFITDLDKRVAASFLRLFEQLNCMVVVTCPLNEMVQFTQPFQLVQLGQYE